MERTWKDVAMVRASLFAKGTLHAEKSKRMLDELTEIVGPKTKLRNIDEFTSEAFIKHLETRPRRDGRPGKLSTKTVSQYLKLFKSCITIAHKRRWVDYMPHVTYRVVENPRKLEITLTDFFTVINCLNPSIRGLCLLSLFTGMRLSDCLDARLDSWDQDENVLKYRSTKTAKDDMAMPMIRPLRDAIGAVDMGGSPLMFPLNGKRISYRRPNRELAQACEKCGINRFTFHHIRHLSGTVYYQLTNDARLVERLIGWKSKAVADRYMHIDEKVKSLVGQLGRAVVALGENKATEVLPLDRPGKRE